MKALDWLILFLAAVIVFGFIDPIFMHGAIALTCQRMFYELLDGFFSMIVTVLRIFIDALITALGPAVAKALDIATFAFGLYFFFKFIMGPMIDATKKAPPKPAGKKKAAGHV